MANIDTPIDDLESAADLVEVEDARVAEATYCAWLGHSPRVSREHYVTPTSDEYQAIIRAA